MFRNNITLASAKKIADTINALISAGDPATAEMLRGWFNHQFRDFRVERMMEGKKIVGYELKSSIYGDATLKATEVRAPLRSPRKFEPETGSAVARSRTPSRRDDLTERLTTVLCSAFDADEESEVAG